MAKGNVKPTAAQQALQVVDGGWSGLPVREVAATVLGSNLPSQREP